MKTKKTDWLILIAAALYSFLFFEQGMGINFLIFDLALVGLLMFRSEGVTKNLNWKIAALGTMLSGVAIAWHGTGYAVFANIISLSLLAAFSIKPESSVIMALVFAVFSYVSAPFFMLAGLFKRKFNENQESTGMSTWTYYILPVIAVIVFFILYRSSNLVFDNWVSAIKFDFISVSWVFFTLGGLLLMYGYFRYRVLPEIYDEAQKLPQSISNNPDAIGQDNLVNVYKSGYLLFFLLNFLILSVNIIDVIVLFARKELPDRITYTDMEHQGVASLIISIIFAISLIIYYLRGQLNFFENNKKFKLLTYIWIAQNIFLLFTTLWKNHIYINEFSLTWKRIGVDFWLILAAFGLLTTIIKIYKAKTIFYLINKNSWCLYIVLVAGCMFNWELIITEFNINLAEKENKTIYKSYLLSLTDANLPYLWDSKALLSDAKTKTADSLHAKNANNIDVLIEESEDERLYSKDIQHALDLKMMRLLGKAESTDWRSWNYDEHYALFKIKTRHDKGAITRLNLSRYNCDKDLIIVGRFTKLEYLDLSNSHFTDFSSLSTLKNLKTLKLNQAHIPSGEKLPYFPALQELDLTEADISNTNDIPDLPNLRKLILVHTPILEYYDLKRFPKLEVLDVRGCNITDYKSLSDLKNVKEIYLPYTPKNVTDSLQINLPNTKLILIDNGQNAADSTLNK